MPSLSTGMPDLQSEAIFGLINLSNIPKKLQTSEVWIIAGVRQSITTEAPPPLFFFAQSAYFGFG